MRRQSGKLDGAELRCRILSTPSEVQPIADAWSSLGSEIQSGGPFQGPAWCSTWWSHHGNESNRPFILTCEREGRLLGLAPLYGHTERGVRFLRVMGDDESADISWLLRKGADPETVVPAMLSALLDSRPSWDAIRLYHIQSGRLLETLRRTAPGCGFGILQREMGNARFLDLSGGVEVALSGLSSRLKNTVKKRKRKAAKRGETRFVTKPEITDLDFERILEVEKRSWKQEAEFRLNTKRDFVREAFRSLGENGQLRYSALWIGESLVAYLISLLSENGRVLAYETAYDREFADVSPGTLVHYEEILSLAEGPERELDFLGGAEKYKSEWTESQRPVHEVILTRDSLRGWLLVRPYVALKWRLKKTGWFG